MDEKKEVQKTPFALFLEKQKALLKNIQNIFKDKKEKKTVDDGQERQKEC